MTKGVVVAASVLFLASTACGGGSGSSPSAPAPISPTPTPTSPTDVTGIWDESTGGDLTWQLVQTGSTVTGSSRFSQQSGPLGAVSGQGMLSGTLSNGTFAFTDNASMLSKPDCSVVVTGQLTLSSSTEMSGRYSEVDSCGGAVLGSAGGTIRMRKR